jgi:hypothetical protein
MKTTKLIISLLSLGLIVFSCSKSEDKASNNYSEYLKVELSTVHDSSADSVCEITILNTGGNEFEQECVLKYSLINKLTNEEYFSNEGIKNKLIINQPTYGLFNLQGGGNYHHLVHLSNLLWDNKAFSDLGKGNYDLRVTLYINDIDSPYNNIYSNALQITK